MARKSNGALVSSGRRFMSSGGNSGRWAGERFMAAVAAGQRISPNVLRTLELLRDEEWKAFDSALVTGAKLRLRAVADLISAGLTFTITNGMAKTILEWDKIGDMNEAIVSMDGVTRDENDRLEFEFEQMPLPITHKDWYLNLRLLEASRLGDAPLDTTYSRVAGEKIGEKTEEILFNGTKQFKNLPIYGYRTHPLRHTLNFGAGGSWGTAGKTGAQMYEDLVTGIQALRDAHQYGPYMVYLPTGAELQMGNDYKAESDKTVQQRLLEIEGMSGFRIVDNVPQDEMIIVSMQSNTVDLVIAERLQTIQWDAHGGFQVNFKGFQIMVPRIRTDADGNSGVVHFTEA